MSLSLSRQQKKLSMLAARVEQVKYQIERNKDKKEDEQDEDYLTLA